MFITEYIYISGQLNHLWFVQFGSQAHSFLILMCRSQWIVASFLARPQRGSFEANPPFVAQVIERMAQHIDELLGASNEPLMFSVIVPEWTENSGKADQVMTHRYVVRTRATELSIL
jgi:hypothetical protein